MAKIIFYLDLLCISPCFRIPKYHVFTWSEEWVTKVLCGNAIMFLKQELALTCSASQKLEKVMHVYTCILAPIHAVQWELYSQSILGALRVYC